MNRPFRERAYYSSVTFADDHFAFADRVREQRAVFDEPCVENATVSSIAGHRPTLRLYDH